MDFFTREFTTPHDAEAFVVALDERFYTAAVCDGGEAVDVQDETGAFLAASSRLKIALHKNGEDIVELIDLAALGANVTLPFNDTTDKATDCRLLAAALNAEDWDFDDSGKNDLIFSDAGHDTDGTPTGILRIKTRSRGADQKLTVHADSDAPYQLPEGEQESGTENPVADLWNRALVSLYPVTRQSQGLPVYVVSWWEPV